MTNWLCLVHVIPTVRLLVVVSSKLAVIVVVVVLEI